MALSQALSDAKVPCENQTLEKLPETVVDLVDGQFTFPQPATTALGCEATGGPYTVLVWASPSDTEPSIRAYCILEAVASLDAEYDGPTGSQPRTSTGRSLAVGPTWVAAASEESIVSTEELARALGGEVQAFETMCAAYADEAMKVTAAERARLDTERQVEEQLQELSGDLFAQQQLAQDETASEEMLLNLVSVGDINMVNNLISNPAATPAVFWALYEKGLGAAFLAGSERTPIAILENLATSTRNGIRITARETLEKLNAQ